MELLDKFIDLINTGEHFSFSRWGDGEWNAVFGKPGMNCDGHNYYPDMGKRLSKILQSSPKYILGLQGLAIRLMAGPINEYTEKYDLKWINSDVFHHANANGQIQRFWDCLKDKDVLLVGPAHLNCEGVKKLFKFRFFEIRGRNCWLQHDRILEKLPEFINDDTIVLFCASMMANVLIDELNGKGMLIDFGSVLDPHAGVKSRSYHRRMNLV